MKNRKLAIVLLINLIIMFVFVVAIYSTFISSNKHTLGAKTKNLESELARLDGKIGDVKVLVDSLEKGDTGEGSIDIDLGGGDDKEEPKDEKPKKEPEEKEDENVGFEVEEEKPKDEKPKDENPKDEKPKEETYKVDATNLNMRSGASTGSSIVESLNSGTKVTATGKTKTADGHNWVEIKTPNGKTGWVSKAFLK